MNPRAFAGSRACDVKSLDAFLGEPISNSLVRSGVLQADQKHGAAQALAARPGQQRATPQILVAGPLRQKDQGGIGVLHISASPFCIIHLMGFREPIGGRYHPVLGAASFGTPATMRNPQFNGYVERSSIDSGLTSRHDATDEKGMRGWHDGPFAVSLANPVIENRICPGMIGKPGESPARNG
jgi:hypothetical protein